MLVLLYSEYSFVSFCCRIHKNVHFFLSDINLCARVLYFFMPCLFPCLSTLKSRFDFEIFIPTIQGRGYIHFIRTFASSSRKNFSDPFKLHIILLASNFESISVYCFVRLSVWSICLWQTPFRSQK